MVTVPITLTEGYGLEGHYFNGVVVVLQMVLGLHRFVYSDTLCCLVLWCDVMRCIVFCDVMLCILFYCDVM